MLGFLTYTFERKFPPYTDKEISAYLQVILESRLLYCRAVSSATTHHIDQQTNHFVVSKGNVLESIDNTSNERDWVHLSEATSSLTRLLKNLSNSPLSRTYNVSVDLKEVLLEAQGVQQELHSTKDYLEGIMGISKGRISLEQSQQSIKMAEVSIAESKQVRLCKYP